MSKFDLKKIKDEFTAATKNGAKPMSGFKVLETYFPAVAQSEEMKYQKNYNYGEREVRDRELKHLDIEETEKGIVISALTRESWWSMAPRAGGIERNWVASAFIIDPENPNDEAQCLRGQVNFAHRWNPTMDKFNLYAAEKAQVSFEGEQPRLTLVNTNGVQLHSFG